MRVSTLTKGGLAAVVCAGLGVAAPLQARATHQAGLALDPAPLMLNDAPALTLKPARDCRRWQSAAQRLGETYGGYRLRAIVDRFGCGFGTAGPARDQAWNWPWHGEGAILVRPPVLHARYGAWEIRCEAVAARTRCAMISDAAVIPHAQLAAPSPAFITTHFVIDTIADRESMIWRVHTPRPAGALKTRTAAAGTGLVSFSLGGPAVSHPFTTCRGDACLMEAPIAASAAATTRLWDGHVIDIDIPAADNGRAEGPLQARISAAGFRAAFRELIKLRHAETRDRAN